MNKRIYFDNSATTRLDPEVVKEMMPYFNEEYGNASSIHSLGQKARSAIDSAREQVADFLSCKTREIIFTSSATEANNLALKGLAEAMHRCTVCGIECADKGKVPHFIVSPIEHHCVFDIAKHLEKMGYEVSWLKVNQHGLVDPKEIEEKIKDNTVLVSVMYVNNEIGTIEPIEEIGQMLAGVNAGRKEKGLKKVYFHTDAVQAVQYLEMDVSKLGVDLLSMSAHKFYGPKGTGVLYSKLGTPLVRQIDGGGQEYYLRAGTENVAGIVGFGEAISRIKNQPFDYAQGNVEQLRDRLIEGVLEKVEGAQLTGHPKIRAPHIASFVIPQVEGEAILLMLDQEGIAASSGSACTSGLLEPSHVLLVCGIKPEIAHGSLRLSLGIHNTEEEVDFVVEKLAEIVKRLREISPEI